MYQVMQWMREVALVKMGLDANQIETVSRSSSLPAWAIEKIGETGVAQLTAMNEVALNWRRMDGSAFHEAMTTAMFATYFGDAISRMFYKDYSYQKGSWQNYTYPDTAPDFRDVKRGRMSEPGTLHKRREKAEAKTTYISDAWYNYGVDEFSRQFDISWRVLMNDDLGKIRETPAKMLQAVNRFEDSFVSALYDNATTQATLVALGTNYAGTGRLTPANLALGINAMKSRVDTGGNLISIGGIWLVIPPILEIQARTILTSTLMAGVATNDANVIPQFIRGYRVDPYIATAAPNVPWYLFAEPSEIPAVPVIRLRDFERPIVAMKRSNIELINGSAPASYLMGSFETGDIEYMVSDVIGGWDDASYVGVVDPNGIYYSSGTTA